MILKFQLILKYSISTVVMREHRPLLLWWKVVCRWSKNTIECEELFVSNVRQYVSVPLQCDPIATLNELIVQQRRTSLFVKIEMFSDSSIEIDSFTFIQVIQLLCEHVRVGICFFKQSFMRNFMSESGRPRL